ncbi:hypothetical protein KKC13_03630 [bacterium]|nr:hypothetical protein [bacterium]MBU1958507.1 hypothetical protein [bacterium]
MKTLELKIDENYIDTVLAILRSLKEGMIQEINIKKTANIDSNSSDLEEFYKLIRRGDNPVQLNYQNATNTEEMIDDIF